MATSDAASNSTPTDTADTVDASTDTTIDTTIDTPTDAPEAVDDAPQPLPSETPAAKPLRRGLAQAVVLGAFGLDMLLYTLVVPFLPARAQALGATPAVTGALFACYAAGLFVATPPSGWLTDRVGARRTLLGGLLALFAATLLFAYAPGLPLLFAARAAQGVSGAVTWTAGLALIAQLYAPDERQKVFASIFTVTGLGTLIGPPLGGALYTLGGFRVPFLFAAALVVLDGLGRVLFLPGKHAVDAAPPTPGATRQLLRSLRFVVALLATLAAAAVFAMLDPNLPPLLAERFSLNTFTIGLFFGGLVIAFSIAQQLLPRIARHVTPTHLMAAGLVASALTLVLLGLSHALPLTTAALLALAAALACVLLPSLDMLTDAGQRQTTGSGGPAYGAIYAAYNLAYAGGLLLGPIASGATITWLGATYGFALAAVVPLLLALILLLTGRRESV